MSKTFVRMRLYNALREPKLLEAVELKGQYLRLVTTCWDKYWARTPQRFRSSVGRLRESWNKYCGSGFNLSHAAPYYKAYLEFGGRFEEYDWDGNLIWEYDYESATHMAHHDVERMPNGNWLIIAWDLLDELDAIAEGKNPADITNGNLLIDSVIVGSPGNPSASNALSPPKSATWLNLWPRRC